MLCLIIQPVIVSWGAIHEAIDHAGFSEIHGDLHATWWQADSTDTDDETDLSHQLMHHAHCCAQPQLPVPTHWQLPAYKPVAKTRWAPTNAIVDDAHAATPFRPPIQA